MSSEIARNLLHVRNTDGFGTVLEEYGTYSTCRSIIAKEFCSCEKYKKIGGPEDTEPKHIVFHV